MNTHRPAFLVLHSANAKVGDVAATYASIKSTCPETCALRNGNGCYAETGNVAIHARRLDSVAYTPEAAATFEARLIRKATPPEGQPLRIHVSGDAKTPRAARTLGAAAVQWRAKAGGPVWSYTHAWANVKRANWGPAVSVLASIEHEGQADAARAQGYAPAMIVSEHPKDGRAWIDSAGRRWIPCPAQTQDETTCKSCRLCWNADGLRDRNAGITFAAHGSSKKRALKVIA